MKIFGHIFYRYLWNSFNTLLGYFYRYSRKRHTSGMERIPNDRPVLFCSNHPNAFMDALVLGSSIRRRTWFLARSDVFRKKALANFLSFIGIIPIYRLLEGAENLAKNDETFEKCAKMLEENKAIMIFSEGLCIQERRLRKLKKGTARIAFSAEEKNNFALNLTIIPVGINYSDTPWKFRKPLYIQFGEPFAVKDYEELYRSDKARAMNLFTRDLEERMSRQLVIIKDKENDRLVAQLEEMFTDKWSREEYRNPENQKDTHHVSKEIAHLANESQVHEPVRLQTLREKTAAYFAQLDQLRTRDWVVAKAEAGQLKGGILFLEILLLILSSPAWIFGVITNYIPYKGPSLIAGKIVKHIEWNASVNGTIAVFLWQFWWLLQSLVVALVFRNWYVLFAFMALVPVTGIIAQECWVLMKKIKGRMSFNKTPKSKLLIAERKAIEAEVEALREKYSFTEN